MLSFFRKRLIVVFTELIVLHHGNYRITYTPVNDSVNGSLLRNFAEITDKFFNGELLTSKLFMMQRIKEIHEKLG